jgi:RNA polymerase sigma-70 factor, ECF subfamily
MRAIEEVTTEETATLLGIRQQTVKTRLHRARRMLRAALGEHIRAAVKDAFPFDKPRCDRLVKKVLDQLGFAFLKSVSR